MAELFPVLTTPKLDPSLPLDMYQWIQDLTYVANRLASPGVIQQRALAANSVGANQIQPNSVGNGNLQPNSVGATEIINNSVGTNELGSQAVQNVNLGLLAVQNPNVDSNAIDTVNVINNAITTVSASSVASFTPIHNVANTTILSMSFTTTGKPLALFWSIGSFSPVTPPISETLVQAFLVVSSLYAKASGIMPNLNVPTNGLSSGATVTLAAGTYTLSLVVFKLGTVDITANDIFMQVIEYKK